MRTEIDLAAYLRRIGVQGNVEPNLATLRALVNGQLAAIAFENLDVLMQVPINLEAAALEDKLVHRGRGGHGFEQNLLLAAALRTLGCTVDCLLARSVGSVGGTGMTSARHVLLRVQAEDGSWLVDAGSAGAAPAGILALRSQIEQISGQQTWRLQQQDQRWQLQFKSGARWHARCEFYDHPCDPLDCEIASHYVGTHESSALAHELCAARVMSDRRLLLHNRLFTVQGRDGSAQSCTLPHANRITGVLREEFGIRVPHTASLWQRLDQLPRMALQAVR